jgi:hypothetical protein
MKICLSIAGIIMLIFLNCSAQQLQSKTERFFASFTDLTSLTVTGKRRFVTIDGQTGFQPTSLHTRAYIETTAHQGDEGTISFWFSPLEDLDFFPRAGNQTDRDPNAFDYPLISDVFPPNRIRDMKFGIYWHNGDPQIMCKLSTGNDGSKEENFYPAYAYIEKVPLRAGRWYQMTVTWSKVKKKIDVFVNGLLMGANHKASDFMQSGTKLYIGCPMMVMRDLTITHGMLSAEKVKADYEHHRPSSGSRTEAELLPLSVPPAPAVSDLKRDESWQKAYDCPFTKGTDLDGWSVQTDTAYLHTVTTRITPEGLYFKTTDQAIPDARCTLWGPRIFEGDQWLELDFRIESPEGLALIVLCAGGVGREDFIGDHGLEMTGKMSPILGSTRNYHWEFLRRVNVIRRDVETQAVYKNPWMKHMYYGLIPKLEQGRWYHLQMVKTGNRVRGSLDNRMIFDFEDDPNAFAGPVLNFGRIGLRHMWQTTVRYKNLAVYERRGSAGNEPQIPETTVDPDKN